jgi:hypothetical protein
VRRDNNPVFGGSVSHNFTAPSETNRINVNVTWQNTAGGPVANSAYVRLRVSVMVDGAEVELPRFEDNSGKHFFRANESQAKAKFGGNVFNLRLELYRDDGVQSVNYEIEVVAWKDS